MVDQEKCSVKDGYVEDEQGYNGQGIQDGASSQEVIEDIVGGAVALHEEHVVGAPGYIGQVCGNTEDAQDEVGDPDVLLLHAGQTRQADIQGSKGQLLDGTEGFCMKQYIGF